MSEAAHPGVTGLPASVASRAAVLVYGGACYLAFLGAFLYAIGFVGNWLVPKSIDSGAEAAPGEAAVVDLLLLGLFAVQHSGMARPGFKRWWTRIVPTPIERSTYVLLSSLVLFAMFGLWKPIPGMVWQVENPVGTGALWTAFGLGWVMVLVSTYLIDHFDLFGLRQIVLYARGQPYTSPVFQTRLFYRYVRHPIMLGFLIAFWATPAMSWGHLLFAGVTTGYILIGIALEERDASHTLGATYEEYRRRVGMLVPRIGGGE